MYTTKVTFHQVFWRIVTLFRVIEIGWVIWDLVQVAARGFEYDTSSECKRLVSFLSTTAIIVCRVLRGSRLGG